MSKRYIYGAGGHGKVVLDAIQAAGASCEGYIDDKSIDIWFGLSVFQFANFDCSDKTSLYVHLAIGNCKAREVVALNLTQLNFSDKNFFSVLHPSSVVAKTANIGVGTFVAANAVIAPDARVGSHCIVNHSTIIDHDCTVGDFCHIAPSSALGGGVKIGRGVLIGTGAVILPNISIADYSVIGAGAVVTKNILSRATVIGNPARVLLDKS